MTVTVMMNDVCELHLYVDISGCVSVKQTFRLCPFFLYLAVLAKGDKLNPYC